MKRPEHSKAAGVSLQDVTNLLNVLARKVQQVEITYLWRPQLRDAADEMVLEAAVNGHAAGITPRGRDGYLRQFSGYLHTSTSATPKALALPG